MRDGSLRDPDVRLGVHRAVIDRPAVGSDREHVVGGRAWQLNGHSGSTARDGVHHDDLPGDVAEVHDATTVGKPSRSTRIICGNECWRVRLEIVNADA